MTSEKRTVTVVESDTGMANRPNASVGKNGLVLSRGTDFVEIPWSMFQGQNQVYKGVRQSQLSLILCGKGKTGVPVRLESGKAGGFITMLVNINVDEETAIAYGADAFKD